MVARLLAIAALICAVLAFFSVHIGHLTSLRLGLVGLGLLAVAALL